MAKGRPRWSWPSSTQCATQRVSSEATVVPKSAGAAAAEAQANTNARAHSAWRDPDIRDSRLCELVEDAAISADRWRGAMLMRPRDTLHDLLSGIRTESRLGGRALHASLAVVLRAVHRGVGLAQQRVAV